MSHLQSSTCYSPARTALLRLLLLYFPPVPSAKPVLQPLPSSAPTAQIMQVVLFFMGS